MKSADSEKGFDAALSYFPNSVEPQIQVLVGERDRANAALSDSLETIKNMQERIDNAIREKREIEVA